ncbi:MAG: DUF3299 domain-containing protein [Methylotenera sp.]|jgi:uncharacterized protein
MRSVLKLATYKVSWTMCLLTILAILGCDQLAHHQTEKDNLQTTASTAYPLIDWSALTPRNWDAMALLKDIDLSNMADDDPRAFDLLEDVREQWNNAPVVSSLDNKNVTIHGYMVPLDGDVNFTKSFLLVPYFGACIHSPPPPSNQVIYVQIPGNGLPLNYSEAYVSVSGSIVVAKTTSELGIAGYQMQADFVQPANEEIP